MPFDVSICLGCSASICSVKLDELGCFFNRSPHEHKIQQINQLISYCLHTLRIWEKLHLISSAAHFSSLLAKGSLHARLCIINARACL